LARFKSPTTLALSDGFKVGSNGIHVVKNVTLGPLGPAKPVYALTQFCDPWAIKVKGQINMNIHLQSDMSASTSDTAFMYIFVTLTL
jgi:hypothetical protein